MNIIGKEVKFKDKYDRVLEGIVVDDNYTLPYGGPIVDGKVTDLEGLVQVKHYETTMNTVSYTHLTLPTSDLV